MLFEGQTQAPIGGEPPLHHAARIGDVEAIRRLVASGAEINATYGAEDYSGRIENVATPIMVAAGSNEGADLRTLEVLLELGADLTLEFDGRNALTYACLGMLHRVEGGDVERVRAVIEMGGNPPSDPRSANRLLCDVAALGNAEMVRILLGIGLNPNGHWDPEEAMRESLEFERSLNEAERDDVLGEFSEELQAQFKAVSDELDRERVEERARGPRSFEIPLFTAAYSGNLDCVELLLEAGAEIGKRDNYLETALYSASSREVIQRLLNGGLSLFDVNSFGWTPVRDALSNSEGDGLERVRMLVEMGADINETCDSGYTLFMSAVGSSRTPEMIRLLIELGADPHAVSDFGYNAFHAAIDVNFEANAEESVRDTLGYIKELGVDIEHRNSSGQTPLARAISHGTALEVRVLCELGANPNATCQMRMCGPEACEDQDEPLILHVINGFGASAGEKARALLEAGADPLATSKEGFIPICYAVAKLCREAEDYDGSYDLFFESLSNLELPEMGAAETKDEFLEKMAAAVRPFVDRFAAGIPIRSKSEYAGEIRSEAIECLNQGMIFQRWKVCAEEQRSTT